MKARRKKTTKVILSVMLAVCMSCVFMPSASFAADGAGTGGEQKQVDINKADSQVVLRRSAKILGKYGGTITGISDGAASYTDKVAYGASKTYKITTNSGYKINKVVVDGINKGAITNVTIKGDEKTHTIEAYFSKDGLFIMLDAGHANYKNGKGYNQGYYKNYYESEMTWSLTNNLKREIEKYPGVVVGMTKKSLTDLSPYGGVVQRGKKAKGYDLFVSIHSNAGSKTADYPLAIVSSKYKVKLYNVAQPLGKKLAAGIRTTMGTKQNYQVWTTRLKNGQDYYGVIRGAASVNVPAILLEHSFHSNPKMCKWLLSNANKNKLAKMEAAKIAEYYGFHKDGSFKPAKTKIKQLTAGKKKVKVKWATVKGATGYVIYRSTSKNGTYKKVKTISKKPMTRTWTNTKLKKGKKYYYKIRAYSTVNGKKIYGAYSAIKSKKAK